MKNQIETKRRSVLKTVGAGLVGVTALTGSAAAACSADTCVALQGHQFLPRNASVSLGSDGVGTVQWTNKEPLIQGHEVPHDVHLKHGDHHLVHSSDDADEHDEYLLKGDSYVVEFSAVGNDLVIEETRDDSSSSVTTTATIKNWGGEVTLDMLCEIHDDFTNMVGTLTVTQ